MRPESRIDCKHRRRKKCRNDHAADNHRCLPGHVAAASTAVTTPMHQKVRQFFLFLFFSLFFFFYFSVLIFNVAISCAERRAMIACTRARALSTLRFRKKPVVRNAFPAKLSSFLFASIHCSCADFAKIVLSPSIRSSF